MAENTEISWTHHTWSPWEGCTKISPGCDHCYAEGMNKWLRKGENWGPGAPRREYSDAHWAKPLRWNDAAAKAGERRRTFPSVCDPFDKEAPDDARARFALIILATPHLDWLLLTKRIGNAAAMLAEMFPAGTPSNVWLGATIVNQEEADRDIPKLLATPAAVRFLSMEPLLGQVTLRREWLDGIYPGEPFEDSTGTVRRGIVYHEPLDWVIVGGESGPGARPMHPDWARSLRDQCAAAGVPLHFKQHGEWREPLTCEKFDTSMGRAARPPAFLICEQTGSVRCFENDSAVNAKPVIRVGKKAAGRLLDGVTHDGFPEVRG